MAPPSSPIDAAVVPGTTSDRPANPKVNGTAPAGERGVSRLRASTEQASSIGTIGLIAVLALALVARAFAVYFLQPQIDEAASLLAIQRTWILGYPLFPSDVLYLQGALLSYLFAPLAGLAQGLDLLSLARLVNILFGVATTYLTARMATKLSGNEAIGILAGLFVALDPSSIEWSVYIRPYSALTFATVALAYVVVSMAMDGPRTRLGIAPAAVWLAVILFIGTFTHLNIWLLAPAVALVAVVLWGRRLLDDARAVPIALGVAALGPLLLLTLNTIFGIGSSTSEEPGGLAFVGSHVLDLDRLLSPDFRLDIWLRLFPGRGISQVVPLVIAAASGILLAALLIRQECFAPRQSRGVFSLLTLHWLTIFVVGVLLSTGGQARYLVHILPLGYVLVPVAAYMVYRTASEARLVAGPFSRRGIAVVLLLAPLLVNSLMGSNWRLSNSGSAPDYFAAMDYVADHHEPGQPIIVALPPVAYLSLDTEDRRDIYFLGGSEDSSRAQRYTRLVNGETVDFWIGAPALTTMMDLCSLLTTSPERSYIVVDEERLEGDWAYGGRVELLINGASDHVSEGDNGVIVALSRPYGAWDVRAQAACIAQSP